MITRADAATAFAGPAPKVEATVVAGGTVNGHVSAIGKCSYADRRRQAITVSVRAASSSKFDETTIRQAAAIRGHRAVAGIGKAAFLQLYRPEPGLPVSALLTFVDDGSYVSITLAVAPSRKSALSAAILRLARTAARRVP